MSETVLVTVRSASTSDKASPTSRIRIDLAVYNEAIALAKQSDQPCKYTIEEDQGCEGMTGAELKAAQLKRKPIREKKEALLAQAAAI